MKSRGGKTVLYSTKIRGGGSRRSSGDSRGVVDEVLAIRGGVVDEVIRGGVVVDEVLGIIQMR